MNPLAAEADARLIELAQETGGQDTRPFEELVRRHRGYVVTNCRFITRSPADAEDLAQEVFVKAFFGLRRFEGRAQFRTWIGRIKVNHCLNYLRRMQGAVMVDADNENLASHPAMQVAPVGDASLAAADVREHVVRTLDTMSDTLRIPLILRDADGFSYEEIADQLGIGLSAVKMRIKRGREEFRRLFERVAPDSSKSDPGEVPS